MLGILHLRSLGYYKIKQGIPIAKFKQSAYKFERADTLCKHFNKFINTLKKEREQKKTEGKLSVVRFQ